MDTPLHQETVWANTSLDEKKQTHTDSLLEAIDPTNNRVPAATSECECTFPGDSRPVFYLLCSSPRGLGPKDKRAECMDFSKPLYSRHLPVVKQVSEDKYLCAKKPKSHLTQVFSNGSYWKE